MSKSLLILDRIEVEDANACAGFILAGFPSATAFLGFVHAIDRRIQGDDFVTPFFKNAAIICNSHQLLREPTNEYNNEFSACIKKHQLDSTGKNSPIQPSLEMNMTVSLVIEIDQDAYDHVLFEEEYDENSEDDFFARKIYDAIMCAGKLAGGHIKDVGDVRIQHGIDTTTRNRESMRVMRPLLPGFLLIDRTDILVTHHEALVKRHPAISMIESWLDFSGLRYRANDVDGTISWERVQKPETGWFVPINIGYQAITELVDNSDIEDTRDAQTPFCAVEPVFGVGQWLSLHRINSIDDVLWFYKQSGTEYLVTTNQ